MVSSRLIGVVLAVGAFSCGGRATLQVADGTGPKPVLPPPDASLVPVMETAPAKGWPEGHTPLATAGTKVVRYAGNLDHPRWLYVLPNGDTLVAETSAPRPRPRDNTGIKGWIMELMMKRVGSDVPSADRITLLRDGDGDGVAEQRSIFLQGLHSPFGMALVGSDLYVADTDALLRFPYRDGQTAITDPGTKVTDLPAGPINHHWTKNVIASRDGSKLYVTVGSNSNVAENGIENERERAAILEVDARTGTYRVFASGLRNPMGLAWVPETAALWTVVNERDELGSDLVPDYMTAVHDGAFYGWPYSYYGQNLDERVQPQRPDLVKQSIPPDYALGPHTASMGLAYSQRNALPASFQHGMFVGQHGSWNRKPRSGYKVVFVPFHDGRPSGDPADVLTGFVVDDEALGRPVGLALDRRGALLVADDVGDVVWRVTGTPAPIEIGSAP
jgi:glucose/arabinose dehydrogenase